MWPSFPQPDKSKHALYGTSRKALTFLITEEQISWYALLPFVLPVKKLEVELFSFNLEDENHSLRIVEQEAKRKLRSLMATWASDQPSFRGSLANHPRERKLYLVKLQEVSFYFMKPDVVSTDTPSSSQGFDQSPHIILFKRMQWEPLQACILGYVGINGLLWTYATCTQDPGSWQTDGSQ